MKNKAASQVFARIESSRRVRRPMAKGNAPTGFRNAPLALSVAKTAKRKWESGVQSLKCPHVRVFPPTPPLCRGELKGVEARAVILVARYLPSCQITNP